MSMVHSGQEAVIPIELVARLAGPISEAIWEVMHGYDGRLLTGDFYPGHDAIVAAALGAITTTANSVGMSEANAPTPPVKTGEG